ncbi:tetrathionate reductase subunit A [Serratia fonticola]|uniref:Tetrathionate reductase subunit A n=1 Tax=Serratia fonticola TaxID=47917 RepID=A0A4U9U5A0_SERFO|nr:tetrathionate reductase subunit A [Serratia fonticola]
MKRWHATAMPWTGERYSGCPTYYPPRFADGSDVAQHYPSEAWPFRLMSFKSHLMSRLNCSYRAFAGREGG